MSKTLSTTVLTQHKHHLARITQVSTPHGSFTTPTFMPVGTRAAVNCLSVPMLQETQSQIILGGNTYHMLVNPGMEIIQAAGGMHNFMDWQQPMLTDSGGFQVFSLSKNKKLCTIDDHGARFKHPTNGKIIHLTPTTSIETQKIIGADIIMAFDECTPESGGRAAAVAALTRTKRWLLESRAAHAKNPCGIHGHPQALFPIIQGGSFRDLREESMEFVLSMDPDGIAIGGEVIGFDMNKTAEVLSWLTPHLPHNKTRYTMGVGLSPQDLIDVTRHGIDIFDCVAPTRNARHGALYHGHTVATEDHWLRFTSAEDRGRILIKKQQCATDERPILEGCDCYTCTHHSRAYLHFLFKSQQALYHPLACIHNIRVMQRTCEAIQATIQQHASETD